MQDVINVSLETLGVTATKTTHIFWADASVPIVEMRFTSRSAESYKAHNHQEFCVGAVTEGVAMTTLRGDTYAISPGFLVLIPPGVVHSCNPMQGGRRSYIMAYFDVRWCVSLQEALFGKKLRREGKLLLPNTTLLESRELYQSLIELATLLPSDALSLEKTEKLTQFATDLFVRTCDLDVHVSGTGHNGIIEEVKSYLEQRADLNITLEELSTRFRCNPYHLLRSFKKAVGLPPHAYMLNARIERAKRLLSAGVAVAAVAAETGFADQSHFHKTFRRILAATPRQYQKRSR